LFVDIINKDCMSSEAVSLPPDRRPCSSLSLLVSLPMLLLLLLLLSALVDPELQLQLSQPLRVGEYDCNGRYIERQACRRASSRLKYFGARGPH
jgi:hypothetical protein